MLPYSHFAIFIAFLVGNWVTAYGFINELVSKVLNIIKVSIIVNYWEIYITKIYIL